MLDLLQATFHLPPECVHQESIHGFEPPAREWFEVSLFARRHRRGSLLTLNQDAPGSDSFLLSQFGTTASAPGLMGDDAFHLGGMHAQRHIWATSVTMLDSGGEQKSLLYPGRILTRRQGPWCLIETSLNEYGTGTCRLADFLATTQFQCNV